jgi:hypothetical protein
MTTNRRVSSSQEHIIERRSRRPLIARAILTAGLILGVLVASFLLADSRSAAAPIKDDPCAPCASEVARFNDSGASALFAVGDAASAIRYNDSGASALFAARDAASAIRYNDSGASALFAARSAASAIRYNDSGVSGLFTAREVASAIRYNDSGVGALFAVGDAASVVVSAAR